MKKIFALISLFLLTIFANGQPTVNNAFCDTFKVWKRDGTNAEFILKNSTKSITGGVLTNMGNGKTAFVMPSSGTIINGTGFVKANGTNITYDNSTYLTSINSSQVTTALGYTPYNATNPNGYITNTALSPYLTTSAASTTYQAKINGTGLTYSTSGTILYKTLNANSEQTYTPTISFTGTTPPSGTTNHTYRYTRLDNIVFFRLNISFSTAASGITRVQLPIASGMPTPENITDFTTGIAFTTPLRANGGNTRTLINPLTASINYNNGSPLIQVDCTSQNIQFLQIQGFYFTNN